MRWAPAPHAAPLASHEIRKVFSFLLAQPARGVPGHLCKREDAMCQDIPDKPPAEHPVHTLFQVSTSGALVSGLFGGVVSTSVILQYGDFGLGTFAGLDSAMIVIDGRVYQAKGDGEVLEAGPDAQAPFAVVTRFDAELDTTIEAAPTLKRLYELCDVKRSSGNLFFAVRLDGRFDSVRTRAVSPAKGNSRLIDAAKEQHEFTFNDADGTLIGIWSPGFSSAFSVPGYHFHFLSDDRTKGGHLLECASQKLRLRLEKLTDFHLALPSTESFSESGPEPQCSRRTRLRRTISLRMCCHVSSIQSPAEDRRGSRLHVDYSNNHKLLEMVDETGIH
jgi:acetolactate decarboxylase